MMQGVLYLLKAFQHDFLRHHPDQRAGLAIVIDDIKPVNSVAAAGSTQQPADGRNKRRLAGAIGTNERDNLAFLNIQRNDFQRLGAITIGFTKVANGQNRCH